MFVYNANSPAFPSSTSDERPPWGDFIDSFGYRLHKDREKHEILLRWLENSGRPLLREEAKLMRSCAELQGIVDLGEIAIARRKGCGRPLCSICGSRPARDTFRQLVAGLRWMREQRAPLFHVTVSPPSVPSGDPSEAVDRARNLYRTIFEELREYVAVDWYTKIELNPSNGSFIGHFHALVAVLGPSSSAPSKRKRVAIPKEPMSSLLGAGPDLSSLIRDVCTEVLRSQFPVDPKVQPLGSLDDPAVKVQPVDQEDKTPLRLSHYLTKAMRCGMTIDDVLKLDVDAVERLIGATKGSGRGRSARLSQSSVGSCFARGKFVDHRRGKPNKAGKAKRGDHNWSAEVDVFLAGTMPTKAARGWAKQRGRHLAAALIHQGDPRGHELYWKVYFLYLDDLRQKLHAGPSQPRWLQQYTLG